MKQVYLNRTGTHLPGDPVDNEAIEAVLGQVGGRPSRARRTVLRSNGIRTRHYAIDRSTGEPTMSNAELTARAILALGDLRGPAGHVDCLACGTSLPDQLMPGHAVMVHGELGWPRLEAVSFAGICLSGTAALKHAWLAVRAGDAQRAVATGSELASPLLLARHFEAETEVKLQQLETRPELAFEKDFLRWMLSDGAGAVLLEDRPHGDCPLRIDWIDLSSCAHELPTCMYAGAEQRDDGSLRGWLHMDAAHRDAHSVMAVKQDVRRLDAHIARATLREPLAEIVDRRRLVASDIDWFLPHLSSHYFVQPMVDSLVAIGLPIPRERWFTNLATCGNTGSASPYIMLDELVRSGRIERGQRVLMFVPESGRFSSGFVFMEAV